jgi:hypothetical protein
MVGVAVGSVVRVAEGEAVCVAVGLCVAVAVGAVVGVRVAVDVAVGVGSGVRVAEGEAVGEGVAVEVAVTVGTSTSVALGAGTSVGVCEAVGAGEGVAVGPQAVAASSNPMRHSKRVKHGWYLRIRTSSFPCKLFTSSYRLRAGVPLGTRRSGCRAECHPPHRHARASCVRFTSAMRYQHHLSARSIHAYMLAGA